MAELMTGICYSVPVCVLLVFGHRRLYGISIVLFDAKRACRDGAIVAALLEVSAVGAGQDFQPMRALGRGEYWRGTAKKRNI